VAEPVKLALAFLEERPASAARSLEALAPADAAALLELVPVRIAAPALARMTSWAAAQCIAGLPAERASALIAQLGSRDALAILRQMSAPARGMVLGALPDTPARHYRRALTYSRSRVGAWVDHDFATATEDHTVAEAVEMIVTRRRPEESVLYVVDAGRRYLGAVAVAALLHSPGTTRLAGLAHRQRALVDSASLAAAAAEPSWSTSLALPVTDSQGELLGGLSRADLEKALYQTQAEEPAAATEMSVLFHLAEAYVTVVGELVHIAPPLNGTQPVPVPDRSTGS
jgi:Mg/Co/Ni transporter MgtE